MIEHFYDNGKIKLVHEMLRICKPGGEVIILVPNRRYFSTQFKQACQKLIGTWKYGFEDDMSPRRLKRLCEKNGIPVSMACAFNPIVGWRLVPIIRFFIKRSGLNTVAHHCSRSIIGNVTVIVIDKESSPTQQFHS